MANIDQALPFIQSLLDESGEITTEHFSRSANEILAAMDGCEEDLAWARSKPRPTLAPSFNLTY